MELNKNSWWIKFYLNFNSYYPSNSCDYFWGSIKSIVITLCLLTLFLTTVSALLSPILLLWYDFNPEGILDDFQVIGIILWCFILICFIGYKIAVYLENQPYKYKPKKKSLIKQWYLDFKNKHCTLITWK